MEDLASRAGISVRTVYSIQAGEHSPYPATRRVLALALGCNPDDLANDETPADYGGLVKSSDAGARNDEA